MHVALKQKHLILSIVFTAHNNWNFCEIFLKLSEGGTFLKCLRALLHSHLWICVSADRLAHLLENWSTAWEVGSSIPSRLTLRVLKFRDFPCRDCKLQAQSHDVFDSVVRPPVVTSLSLTWRSSLYEKFFIQLETYLVFCLWIGWGVKEHAHCE